MDFNPFRRFIPGFKLNRRQTGTIYKPDLLGTPDLAEAIRSCRHEVRALARECEQRNRKHRDIEFDLIEDQDRCLYGLNWDKQTRTFDVKDVRRVTDIYENPRMFIEGASASDIGQGQLNDCWFLSALAVVASASADVKVGSADNKTRNTEEDGDGDPRLIRKICVEYDIEAGIYGFVFWKNGGWVRVVVDDLLPTTILPWESLGADDRRRYQYDREDYEDTVRKGSKNLLFARSLQEGEVWVPLIEKAYAKLHGDYDSLNSGFTSEGVEDLTGGVATLFYTRDIYNRDKFWNDDLKKVGGGGSDRVFACFTPGSAENGNLNRRMRRSAGPVEEGQNGLIIGHAYSVTRAVEFHVKEENRTRRFLRVRNPWGRVEWRGKWSDGSKEWNDEWTKKLQKEIGDYKFGDDGEFVQEYGDFLQSWGIIEKCRLFDQSWKMKHLWLRVPAGSSTESWSYGDVSFTFTVPTNEEGDLEKTIPTVLVLSQLDTRAFRELSGLYIWSLNFALFGYGEAETTGYSTHSTMWDRSVNLEADLKPGKYVVQASFLEIVQAMIVTRLQVRIDRMQRPDAHQGTESLWDERKLRRKRAEKALAQSVAINFDPFDFENLLPLPNARFHGQSVMDLDVKAYRELKLQPNYVRHQHPGVDVERPHTSESPLPMHILLPNISKSSSNVPPAQGALRVDHKTGSRRGTGSNVTFQAKAPGTSPTSGLAYSRPTEEDPQVNSQTETPLPADDTAKPSRPNVVLTPIACPLRGQPTQYVCSNCQDTMEWPLYYCMESPCIGFYLCATCNSHNTHPHSGVVECQCEDELQVIIARAAPAKTLANPHADQMNPQETVTIGLRVYTPAIWVEDLKGQLRTGDLYRKFVLSPLELAEPTTTSTYSTEIQSG